MTHSGLHELDLAVLRHDLREYGLIAGDVGTVVLVHGAGAGYEVEFVSGDGTTVAVETLRADEVGPVGGQSVLHARKLAVA